MAARAPAEPDVLSDLVNQETGLRGFVLGKREVFLQPYRQYSSAPGRPREARCARCSSAAPTCSPILRPSRTQADTWRSRTAQQYIAEVRRGDPHGGRRRQRPGRQGRSSTRSARAVATADRPHPCGEQRREGTSRHAAILFCFIAAVVAAALTLGSKYVLWRGLQRQVLDPVDDLAGQTRGVAAGGALATQITPERAAGDRRARP